MSIWALADPHLAFNTPSKDMSVFGPTWQDSTQKIEKNWKTLIGPEDLVLIPGDISWASSLAEAEKDLLWLDALPGTKLLIRGNHDYWWASNAKMTQALPPSIHFIHNTAFDWHDVTIGGTRLWDTSAYNFQEFIVFKENPRAKKELFAPLQEHDEKTFAKELIRLRTSLQGLNPKASLRIALTHYPPVGAALTPSAVSTILEEFHIDICVFGHLHSVRPGALPFGLARGVNYVFASADYLDFCPIQIRGPKAD